MNIEQLREFCLRMPLATEDIPFSTYPSIVAFRLAGKIFAMIDADKPTWFVLKCDPDYAIELREKYPEITPAWHMNKKYWNQVDIFGGLSDKFIEDLVRESYAKVAEKIPAKKLR